MVVFKRISPQGEINTESYKEFGYFHVLPNIVLLKADYWKSQSRKYCDFCKCWIADNKPSIDFHEKGRRHKNNVAKRINTIQKNCKKEEREMQKVDQVLRQMESAALEAYRKDVENNADLTSVALKNKLKQNSLQLNDNKKIWHELKSSEGHSYYWNVLTNETVWEPPKDGYLSLAEQRDVTVLNTTAHSQMPSSAQERIRLQELQQQAEEERARQAREKLKERRVEDLPPVVHAPIIPPGKTDPYGQWQTVKTNETVVDLQLPQQQQSYEVPEFEPEEPIPQPKEFKEKTVESLGEGSAVFKKRKIGMGAKLNIRQRTDD